jgi:L-cysteine:1D-myo-inositol 2-amino-2-deoxy-alpha-D-glucopyranoside ligase
VEAWTAPEVPTLPGSPPPLRVHDTASGELRTVDPGDVFRMYVCGITPYDATHLGHAATYLAFDLVVRVLRDAGQQVRYVQNVTDVDDPLLERARETGEDWQQLARRETQLFRDDMSALRVVPPDVYVGAVEAIPLIERAVARLRDAGAAYDVDGDLYFSVDADEHFGEVSHLDRDAMRVLFGERGGDPDRAGKKDPLDCLLWQAARPDEPSWDGPLGPGRPGWHVECAAIALEHLGGQLDIQGGGSDLVFPHHEMSASEAQVLTGQHPYARAYVHSGMVGLHGEKMSKSLGNLVLVSDLRSAGVDPMAVRLALLAHRYRDDWEWTDADLPAAQDRLAAWRAAVARPAGPAGATVLAEVRAALADDLDAPRALRAVDAWAAEGGDDRSSPALVRSTVDALLGVALEP